MSPCGAKHPYGDVLNLKTEKMETVLLVVGVGVGVLLGLKLGKSQALRAGNRFLSMFLDELELEVGEENVMKALESMGSKVLQKKED